MNGVYFLMYWWINKYLIKKNLEIRSWSIKNVNYFNIQAFIFSREITKWMFCGSHVILKLLPPTVQTARCAPLYIVTEAVCCDISVSRKREFLLTALGAVGQMCTVPSTHDEVTSALMSLIVCSVHILRMLHWSHSRVSGGEGGGVTGCRWRHNRWCWADWGDWPSAWCNHGELGHSETVRLHTRRRTFYGIKHVDSANQKWTVCFYVTCLHPCSSTKDGCKHTHTQPGRRSWVSSFSAESPQFEQQRQKAQRANQWVI